MSKKCSRCGLPNPDWVERCGCGAPLKVSVSGILKATEQPSSVRPKSKKPRFGGLFPILFFIYLALSSVFRHLDQDKKFPENKEKIESVRKLLEKNLFKSDPYDVLSVKSVKSREDLNKRDLFLIEKMKSPSGKLTHQESLYLARRFPGNGTFNACVGNGLAVCREDIQRFPRYFENHRDCRSRSCGLEPREPCHVFCPSPADQDH